MGLVIVLIEMHERKLSFYSQLRKISECIMQEHL